MAGTSVSFGMDMTSMRRGIRRAASRIRDVRIAGEEIGEMLVSSTVERFDRGEGPDGTSWEPSRRAQAEGGKTLVDRGTLRGSISYEASPQAVVVGSNLVYARPHQDGGKVGRGLAVTLPARPYLGISDEDGEEAAAILLDHIRKGFAE